MTLRIKDNSCPHDWKDDPSGPPWEKRRICILCKNRRTVIDKRKKNAS